MILGDNKFIALTNLEEVKTRYVLVATQYRSGTLHRLTVCCVAVVYVVPINKIPATLLLPVYNTKSKNQRQL